MVFLSRHFFQEIQMSEDEFLDSLNAAKPGEEIEYHRGFLVRDCYWETSLLASEARAELMRMAKSVRFAAREGLVFLYQRRHGDSDFSYLAKVPL